MKTIMKIKFGSHLYGTSTSLSDIDYKSIFVPDRRDILLQRVKNTISTHRPKIEGEKNFAGEIDEEAYSVQYYLKLLSEGQTVALDILFSSIHMLTEKPTTWEWLEIINNRNKLISRKSTSFVGYCRQQANKYGIKGSRVAAARTAYETLCLAADRYGPTTKLMEIENHIKNLCTNNEHMSILDIEGATDVNGVKRTVRHWEVCNRKMPFTQTIQAAREVMRRIVTVYGHRSLQAESNKGVDWKALSHAVRIGQEAIELLSTGHITFPRPNAKHLLSIKLGEIDYKDVANEIEELLVFVEQESEKSTLPNDVDKQWIDSFIEKVHEYSVNYKLYNDAWPLP